MFKCCYKTLEGSAEELIVGPPVFNDDHSSMLHSGLSMNNASSTLRQRTKDFLNACTTGVELLYDGKDAMLAIDENITTLTISLTGSDTTVKVLMKKIQRIRQDRNAIIVCASDGDLKPLVHEEPLILFCALTLVTDQSRAAG
ncbi:hypothetical protein GNI_070510 [Gregarina niphandrodes]|uniref:Uncharacterized protein n=1 Tax=Gregarina niphandrodes TaxID=110365 RepID=A0A023B7G3_GRENI|nr:hypothetical protein GNI_070510 [Gregarina niphandrodes]EZG67212.1 hypothetical protein GNI_070510 [Gregarina niphandrodes]|eukprot:XP_011130301.1 hypothetical protein GNI_070510 [Gregarina niphandrodes]